MICATSQGDDEPYPWYRNLQPLTIHYFFFCCLSGWLLPLMFLVTEVSVFHELGCQVYSFFGTQSMSIRSSWPNHCRRPRFLITAFYFETCHDTPMNFSFTILSTHSYSLLYPFCKIKTKQNKTIIPSSIFNLSLLPVMCLTRVPFCMVSRRALYLGRFCLRCIHNRSLMLSICTVVPFTSTPITPRYHNLVRLRILVQLWHPFRSVSVLSHTGWTLTNLC